AMPRLPTLLQSIRVTESANCPRRADQAAAFALWEQAQAALLATVVAREANPATVVRLTFDREMDRTGDEAVKQSVHADSAVTTGGAFVASRPAAEFVLRGFVDDSAGHQIFYGPDADVLLDSAFVRRYCFQLAKPNAARSREIGLTFAPVDSKRGRIDIEGTMWIDSTARSLRELDYRYRGIDGRLARYNPGGVVSFRTMENGTSIIDRWMIRVVTFGAGVYTGVRSGRVTMEPAINVHEQGGEVA